MFTRICGASLPSIRRYQCGLEHHPPGHNVYGGQSKEKESGIILFPRLSEMEDRSSAQILQKELVQPPSCQFLFYWPVALLVQDADEDSDPQHSNSTTKSDLG